MHEAIDEALLAGRGLVLPREHPGLRWQLRQARERGELVAVLRGVYAAAGSATLFQVRVLALVTLDPDAVLLGPSAAVAHGWRQAAEGEEVVASSLRLQGSRPGFRLTRRRIDPCLVVERGEALPAPGGGGTIGVRATDEAVTALDLARGAGADPLDDALRRGQALGSLHEALAAQGRRRGNPQLRTHLADSRDEPWSAAERAGHRGLRDRRVCGWRTNWAVERAPGGRLAFLDIAFPHLRLAIEIDGYEHHHRRDAFDHDRLRDLDLSLRGWEVVRVPAAWVLADPARFAARVAQLRDQRALTLGLAVGGTMAP